MKKIVAVIPARSGSKSVVDKNVRILNGLPMMAYSIQHAIASSKIDRVIVSTDSVEYKKIAESYGAEVPFLRPAEISGDNSLDIEVFQHTLSWLQEHEGYEPDIMVHLRPTHPIREVHDIDIMIQTLENNPNIDSVRSVSRAKQIPYKMWLFQEKNPDILTPLASCSVREAYNAPRQSLPEVYMQNACIDIVRASVIREKGSMTGDTIAGHIMPYDYDIDTEEEFLRCEKALILRGARERGEKLKIVCDIDGIIAEKTEGNDYRKATPLEKNIECINALYEMGHQITLFTARGYTTGIDWESITKAQMTAWKVKYHELYFGKPNADVYIDDKFVELSEMEGII